MNDYGYSNLDALTSEQESRLFAVIDELASFPTPELIVESARLRTGSHLDESAKKRMQLALSGAIALTKIMSYLQTLRDLDERRIELNGQILELRLQVQQKRLSDPVATVAPQLMAVHLAGMMEITLHLVASCVAQIERLLPIVARSAGYKIRKEDRDLLETYVQLRHYFEHMDERLPGGKHQNEVVTETQNRGEWHLKHGFAHDGDGRIVINDRAIDVTTRGLTAIEEILKRVWEPLRQSSLEDVRKHFISNPNEIPDVDQIEVPILFSVIESW